MAFYTVDLDDTLRSAVAHLRLEDEVFVTGPRNRHTVLTVEDADFAWFHVHGDHDGLRPALFSDRRFLLRNSPTRHLPAVREAVDAVGPGGVALLTYEQRQRYGRTEWAPVGHHLATTPSRKARPCP